MKNNSLQWYLSGSLATIIMADAESITEIELDKDNNIKSEIISKEITEQQRNKMKKFTRKLGFDIDVVNVNGDLFSGAPATNKPHIKNIIQNVPNILDLMSWSKSIGGSMYIDRLESERKISYHPVAKVKTQNGYVYVTAPPEQLAHKLAETMKLSGKLSGEKVSDDVKSDYLKDIKDVSSMFYGFKDLYENEEFLDRIYHALNEKDNSLFSINNPLCNGNNAMKWQKILDTLIIKRIIEDARNYLRDITDDDSDVELNEFFNNLIDKRRLDVEAKEYNEKIKAQQTEKEI